MKDMPQITSAMNKIITDRTILLEALECLKTMNKEIEELKLEVNKLKDSQTKIIKTLNANINLQFG